MLDQITTSAAGLAELQAQLDELEGAARREIAERIKTAREWGDLKENSEYHDAKNDQAHLETKIARLRERISGAVVVDDRAVTGIVKFGGSVTAVDESGHEVTWRIVSSHEASQGKGLLSVESPVAKALLGLGPGEVARVRLPRGERQLTVVRVG